MDSTVGSNRTVRKVLIVEGDAAVRSLIFTILARVGCDSETAEHDREALDKIHRESFDAVLLDLRYPGFAPASSISQIYDLRPNLVGRILVLTADVVDRNTLEFIEDQYLLAVRGNGLIDEFTGLLRALLRILPETHSPIRT